MASLPPGVTGAGGLVLNAGQTAFLGALRRAVPGIPLYVTSGTRTPERQAAAMVTKRSLGEDLRSLYQSKDIAGALMAAPNTVPAMAAILRRYMAQGRFLSRHMRGDAVDIRSRNLTVAQRNAVMSAARRLGARPGYETTPPHIHIGSVGGAISDAALAAQDAAGRVGGALYRQRRKIGAIYATSAVIALIVVAALIRRKRSL